MNQVETDVAGLRCRVGGGATLGQRDVATQEHGLATTAGIVGHTGVGGLTLTGGMGWLTRKHGLALDNVLAVEIVTADGMIRRASADEEPDLYWAVRGGGGNFGVVTGFESRLHPVGPMVDFGLLFWPINQVTRRTPAGAPAVRLVVDRDEHHCRRESTPARTVRPCRAPRRSGVALVITGFGGDGEHGRVLERINAELPPLFQLAMPMPYVGLQQMFDEANHFGLLAYDKATYVEDLSDDVVSVLADHLARKQSPQSAVFLYRLDGAYSSIGDDDTAFGGGRSPRYAVFLLAIADEPALLATDTEWAREFLDCASARCRWGVAAISTARPSIPTIGSARASARKLRPAGRHQGDTTTRTTSSTAMPTSPAPQPPQQQTPED